MKSKDRAIAGLKARLPKSMYLQWVLHEARPDAQHFRSLPLSSCPLSDEGGRRRLETRVGQVTVRINTSKLFSFPAHASVSSGSQILGEYRNVKFTQGIRAKESATITQKESGRVLEESVSLLSWTPSCPLGWEGAVDTVMNRGWQWGAG